VLASVLVSLVCANAAPDNANAITAMPERTEEIMRFIVNSLLDEKSILVKSCLNRFRPHKKAVVANT
jgi:hypothetical protein